MKYAFAFCAQAREYLRQSKLHSYPLSRIVRKSTNSTASSEKPRFEASLRLSDLEQRAEENISSCQSES